MPSFDTAVETLAERAGVTRREKHVEADEDGFAALREKFADGRWAVGAIVTNAEGQVLLVREDGRWLAPGGQVEPGETHAEALVREVREETGVEVVPDDPVAVTEVTVTHGGETVGFAFAHYTATPETTTLAADPGRDGEGITTAEWRPDVPADTVDRDVVVANR
jgi:8-oxo-dGTP diphosphatase